MVLNALNKTVVNEFTTQQREAPSGAGDPGSQPLRRLLAVRRGMMEVKKMFR